MNTDSRRQVAAKYSEEADHGLVIVSLVLNAVLIAAFTLFVIAFI